LKNEKSKVIISKIDKPIENVIEILFDQLGGVKKYIPQGKIIIKVNGVHFTKYSYTNPQILDAVLKVLIKNGADPNKIYIIENCTSGLFTRMVFKITKLDEVCKKNQVNIVYMDEGNRTTIKLGKEKYEVVVSEFAFNELINNENRKNNIFIEIPKLKTHWCTKITLGIKLLLGMLRDVSKAFKHHYYHEERLVDIFEAFKPDLCIVDGINGVAVGPCPPQNPDILPDYIYDYNLIIASNDIVAIDAVGAKLLGLTNLEVPTTKIAHERNLGCGDIDKIEIVTIPKMNINSLVKKIPWKMKNIFPNNVDILYGDELACYEGCVGLTLIYLEILTLENPSLKDTASFTLLFGKGFDKNKLTNLKEPVCLMGTCCVKENSDFIKSNYNQVYEVNLCGNLGQYCNLIFKITGIDPLSQIPTDQFPLVELLWHYIIAKINKLDASLPDLPSIEDILDLLSTNLKSLSSDTIEDPEFYNILMELIANPNEKIRANATKIAVNMVNNDHKYFELINNALHDNSNKVLKSALKEILKVAKYNKKIVDELKPAIEKLNLTNKNQSITKLCLKISNLN